MRWKSLLAAQLVGLAAAGCAALPPQGPATREPPAREVPRGDGPGAEAPARVPDENASGERGRGPSVPGGDSSGSAAPGGAASAVLLQQSRSQRDAGELAAAAASIERALRIDPNDAALWVELGEIRLAQGDAGQAEMMARKALTLAGDDRGVTARASRLIGR